MRKIVSLLLITLSAFVAAPRAANAQAREIDHGDLYYDMFPNVAQVRPDGVVEVRWSTRAPSPPSSIHFGASDPAQTLSEPRFMDTARETAKETSADHAAEFNVSKLMTKKLDIGGWLKSDAGMALFRIDGYDPVEQRSRIWDGRVCFVRNAAGYLRAPCPVIGPMLARVEPRAAVVFFETDLPSRAVVALTDPKGKTLRFSSAASTRHEIALTGLQPDTHYTYAVTLSSDAVPSFRLPAYSLRTAPAPGSRRAFRFAVLADSRGSAGGPEQNNNGVNTASLRSLMRSAHRQSPDFYVFTGDSILGYVTRPEDFDNQFRSWFNIVESAGRYAPIYLMMGNHETLVHWYDDGKFRDGEGDNSSEAAFARTAVNPLNAPEPEDPSRPAYTEAVYSFDYAGCHFAFLNTDYWYTKNPETHPGNLRGNIMPKQLEWLEADLAAAHKRGSRRIFVFAHEPAFPNGGHVEDAMYYAGKKPEILAMRDRFWNMLIRNNVSAAFFAHEHNYSRTIIDKSVNPAFTRPIAQFISGGGGATPVLRDSSVPWASGVHAFSAQEHFLLIDVATDGKVRFRAQSIDGGVIDQGAL